MPPFRGTITKSKGVETWNNVYWIDSLTLNDAHLIMADIADLEVALHSNNVVFERFRTDDAIPGSDVFRITIMGGAGSKDLGGPPLPLFNTARVDFSAQQGRPSRKYYRGCIGEGQLNGDLIELARLAEIQAIADQIVAIPQFVDIDGENLFASIAFATVQMRQLRRGSKRRTPAPGP